MAKAKTSSRSLTASTSSTSASRTRATRAGRASASEATTATTTAKPATTATATTAKTAANVARPATTVTAAAKKAVRKIPAQLVIHGLSSAVLYPNPYQGPGCKFSWETREVKDVSIAGTDGRIVWIGPADRVSEELAIGPETEFFNGQGLTAVPGFVDSHTHLVYAGSRCDEFEMRVQGRSYLDIMAAGGGILRTVAAVREISGEELFEISLDRIWRLIKTGVTTVEIKSGYGLDLDNELKMLEVINRLNDECPIKVVPTFMGAHAIPAAYKKDPDAFVNKLCKEWIPEIAQSGLAVFNDVFTENKAFTVAQSRRILEAGLKYGMVPKIHADEINVIGGVDLAIELGAVSADHLLMTDKAGIKKLAKSGVIPTLLPGTSTFLMETHHAKARDMIAAGLPVAIASDHNPGSCQFFGAPILQSLAMLQLKMSASEALIAATLHAGHALGIGDEVGAIEVGRQMDLALLASPSFRNLGYQAGMNIVHTVISQGMPIPHS
jgi:imidazolonepropionase